MSWASMYGNMLANAQRGGLIQTSSEFSRAANISFYAGSSIPFTHSALWAPKVTDLPAFQMEARRAFPNYTIYELDANRTFVSVAPRSVYFPVLYIVPPTPLQGYDLFSEPTRVAAINTSIESTAPTISARVHTEYTDRATALLFFPVFNNSTESDDSSTESAEMTLDNLSGVIVCPFIFDEFVAAAMRQLDTDHINTYLFDLSAPPGQQFLTSICGEDDLNCKKDDELSGLLLDAIDFELKTVYEFTFATRSFALVVVGRPGYTSVRRSHIPLLVLVTCLACGVLGQLFNIQFSINALKLKASERECAQQRDIALLAANTQRAFLSTMSHEFRTPINGVMGMTEVLVQRLDGEMQELAQIAHNQASKLLTTVEDVLDFSEMQSGKWQYIPSDFDLREKVETLMDSLSKHCTKRIDFSCFFALPSESFRIYADFRQTEKVMSKYLLNAFEYTETGGVVIRISAHAIPAPRNDFECNPQHLRTASLPFCAPDSSTPLSCCSLEEITNPLRSVFILISVVDTGAGIRPSVLPLLFRPFVQADNTDTRKHGGSGLGLTICKEIAKSVHGVVWATSQEHVGSVFNFAFPVRVTEARGTPVLPVRLCPGPHRHPARPLAVTPPSSAPTLSMVPPANTPAALPQTTSTAPLTAASAATRDQQSARSESSIHRASSMSMLSQRADSSTEDSRLRMSPIAPSLSLRSLSPLTPPSRASPTPPERPLIRKRALLIEREHTAQLLSDALRLAGYDVVYKPSIPAAVDYITAERLRAPGSGSGSTDERGSTAAAYLLSSLNSSSARNFPIDADPILTSPVLSRARAAAAAGAFSSPSSAFATTSPFSPPEPPTAEEDGLFLGPDRILDLPPHIRHTNDSSHPMFDLVVVGADMHSQSFQAARWLSEARAFSGDTDIYTNPLSVLSAYAARVFMVVSTHDLTNAQRASTHRFELISKPVHVTKALNRIRAPVAIKRAATAPPSPRDMTSAHSAHVFSPISPSMRMRQMSIPGTEPRTLRLLSIDNAPVNSDFPVTQSAGSPERLSTADFFAMLPPPHPGSLTETPAAASGASDTAGQSNLCTSDQVSTAGSCSSLSTTSASTSSLSTLPSPKTAESTAAHPKSHAAQLRLETAIKCPLQVLVVDDTPSNVKVALRMLELLGYRGGDVGVATGGIQALDMLKQAHYDLVLMDIQMPDITGIEATRQLRASTGINRSVQIIAMTAQVAESTRLECFAVGMNDFMSKPLALPTLESHVVRAYNRIMGGMQTDSPSFPSVSSGSTSKRAGFEPPAIEPSWGPTTSSPGSTAQSASSFSGCLPGEDLSPVTGSSPQLLDRSSLRSYHGVSDTTVLRQQAQVLRRRPVSALADDQNSPHQSFLAPKRPQALHTVVDASDSDLRPTVSRRPPSAPAMLLFTSPPVSPQFRRGARTQQSTKPERLSPPMSSSPISPQTTTVSLSLSSTPSSTQSSSLVSSLASPNSNLSQSQLMEEVSNLSTAVTSSSSGSGPMMSGLSENSTVSDLGAIGEDVPYLTSACASTVNLRDSPDVDDTDMTISPAESHVQGLGG